MADICVKMRKMLPSYKTGAIFVDKYVILYGFIRS